jgi:TadE-like protein
VAAEFAIALPAVVLVLACCLSGLQVAGQQLRLQDAAAAAARSAARGDGTSVASRLVPGASAARSDEGDLVCVTLTTMASIGWLRALELRASSCALGGGR